MSRRLLKSYNQALINYPNHGSFTPYNPLDASSEGDPLIDKGDLATKKEIERLLKGGKQAKIDYPHPCRAEIYLYPINLTEHATGLLVSGLLLKSRRKDTRLRKSCLHKLLLGLTLNEMHHIQSYCLQKRDRLGKLSGQDRLLLECIYNIGEIGRMNILKKSNFGK